MTKKSTDNKTENFIFSKRCGLKKQSGFQSPKAMTLGFQTMSLWKRDGECFWKCHELLHDKPFAVAQLYQAERRGN